MHYFYLTLMITLLLSSSLALEISTVSKYLILVLPQHLIQRW